jgi:hypothetical protein
MPVQPLPLQPNQSTTTLQNNMAIMAANQSAANFKVVAAYYMYNLTNSAADRGVLGNTAGSTLTVEFIDSYPLPWQNNIPPQFPYMVGADLIQSDNCTVKIPESGTYLLTFKPIFAEYISDNVSCYASNFSLQVYKNGSVAYTFNYFTGTVVIPSSSNFEMSFAEVVSFSANDLIKLVLYRPSTVTYTTTFKGYMNNLISQPNDELNHCFILYRLF